MKRSEKSLQLKNDILDVARDLFISQGYQLTTIRQITARMGINPGSLYHFFRNKEDIFRQIVIQSYREIIDYSETVQKENRDPAFRYSITRALELKAIEQYDRIAELYYVAYSSWDVTQAMLAINMERKRMLFHAYNPGFTDRDYHNCTLALRGMRFSFISERLHEGPGNLENNVAFLIKTALAMVNVPSDKTRELIPAILDIIKNNTLAILGFEV